MAEGEVAGEEHRGGERERKRKRKGDGERGADGWGGRVRGGYGEGIGGA